MKRTIALLLGMSGAWGCGDGQAGSDYRGEPLMSLKGVVTSSELVLTSDLVPALSFGTVYRAPADPWITHYVKSEVDGNFPNAFTMRVYEPPPAEILKVVSVGEPAYAIATMLAVTAAHPKWLRKQSTEVAFTLDSMELGGQRDEICSDAGQCVASDPATPCEPGPRTSTDAWPCGANFPEEYPWDVYGSASKYFVLYLAGPVTAGSVLSRFFAGGQAIATGYHVLRTLEESELSPEALAAMKECNSAAADAAHAEFNRIHGTSYERYRNNEIFQNPALNLEYDGLIMRAEVDRGCQLPRSLITTDALLELQFSAGPVFSEF